MIAYRTTPFGRRANLTLCYLALMVDGFDLVTNGLIAPQIAPEFGMGTSDLGMLFGLTSLGMLIGAVGGGMSGDRYGPKWGLVQALVTFGIASLLTALASNAGTLIAIRVCTGIGIGAALPNVLSYAGTLFSGDRSAGIGTVMASAVPVGGGIAGLLIFLMPQAMTWQTIVVIGGILPLVIAIPLVLLLPDVKVRSGKTAKVPSLTSVLEPERRGVTLTLWVSSFLMMTIFYVLVNWLPTFFGHMGLNKGRAGLMMLIFTYTGALSAILFGILMQTRSRIRPLALTGFGGTAVAALGLQWAGPDAMTIAMAVVFASVCSSGAQCLLFGVSPTLYPPELRGSGTGAAIAAGRLGAIAGPMGAGFVLALGGTYNTVFLLIMPIAIAALTATLMAIKSMVASPLEAGNH